MKRRKLTDCDVSRLLRLYGPQPAELLPTSLDTRFGYTGPTERDAWAEDLMRERVNVTACSAWGAEP